MHLKVMTFNVNWGGSAMETTARAIQNRAADVVALQETTPAWERFLRKRCGGSYPHMAFRHGPGAGGMAFLSRRPFTTLAVTRPARGGWFFAWRIRAQTPAGPVDLLNVHLRPPLGESGRTSTVVSGYFSTRSIRLREIKHHFGRPDHRRPFIVLGDFNEPDNGRAIRWLKGRGFLDALAQFDKKTATWKWRTSVYTLRSRLDHILYSPTLKCVAARVGGRSGSDHFPVEAVFRLN